jgi:hypothetical protein
VVMNTAAKIIEQLRCIGEVLCAVVDLRLRGDFVNAALTLNGLSSYVSF